MTREIRSLREVVISLNKQIKQLEQIELNKLNPPYRLLDWVETYCFLEEKDRLHKRLFNVLKGLCSGDIDTTIEELKGKSIYKVHLIGKETGDLFNKLISETTE